VARTAARPGRQYPLVEIFFIDIQELQVLTTLLIFDFGCISFILVVCFSELFKCIVFTLHLGVCVCGGGGGGEGEGGGC
jgi:hypothetical protein